MGNEINTRTQLLLASYKDKMSASMQVAAYTVPGSSPIAYDAWSEGAQVYTSLDDMDATQKAALAALTCAELEFTVNGDRQWIAPVNSFNQETVLSNSNKDGKNVSAPVFVNDEVLMQYRLHLPQGIALPSGFYVAVEVCMYGAECRIAR